MLRNGHHAARTLARQLGRSAVRQYRHGLFAALVPPCGWGEGEAVEEAELLAASLADNGLPVRHAGSFGFDFVAIEGFFDTGVERHLLRVAAADLPKAVSTRITDGITAWWTRRWRRRVA
jgi:nitroreductase